jgi:hypothetical protein
MSDHCDKTTHDKPIDDKPIDDKSTHDKSTTYSKDELLFASMRLKLRQQYLFDYETY